MKDLIRLHEEFIDVARRPMNFKSLPVLPKKKDVPIVVVNKWIKIDNSLRKIYQFRLISQRNDFIQQILEHEEEIGHHAMLLVKKENVEITLQTHDIEQITELDKEFAKWLDELFKDVVYSVSHE